MINKKFGFSLVELIVVVAIVLVLISIGVAAISSFTQSRKLDTAGNELSSQIKLARNIALTSQLPEGAIDGFSFVKLIITSDFNVEARAIKMVGVGLTSDLGQYFSKKIGTVTDLTINSPTPPVTIGFSVANGRLVNTVTGEFIDGPIELVLKIVGDADDEKKISINNLGLIDE
jgi:prepilin-type N-terminal cleavage/methylation domain-containing protein